MGRVLRLLLVVLVGCTHTEWQAEMHRPGERVRLDQQAPFLKVHLRDGEVFALAEWGFDETARVVYGEGVRYDAERRVVGRGAHRIPIDRVALLETNRPRSVVNTGAVVLGVVSGLSLGVNVFCAASPKTCYGSCPTFYTDDGRGPALQAEGFSGAVARALEETDVDAMPGARAVGGRVEVVMRNEAAETHAVRSVRLVAVPRPEGRRVVRAGASYFALRSRAAPGACRGSDRDCTADVAAADGREDAPRVDPTDLGAQETLTVSFAGSAGRRGLVVTARNSLVGTFVFYRFLGWLGLDAGALFAALERDDPRRGRILDAMRVGRSLARIRVEARAPGGPWLAAGEHDELGPIARETALVPLPEGLPDGPVEVRLTMTRGFWKLDELALAEIEPAPGAAVFEPSVVLRRGRPDPAALASLRDPERHLLTSPGDAYTLVYEAPGGDDAELFLESRGYYVEWVREEWLADQDAAAAASFLADPRAALRSMAPDYARIEPGVEEQFWRTRVGERP